MRLLAALLALATVALAGGERLTSPALQPVSLSDPAPPTDVTITPGDQQLAISWTAPANETLISGYKVYLDGVERAAPTGTSVTITALTNGRTYSVTVRTVTLNTNTGTTSSAPQDATPRDTVNPAPPSSFTAVRGDGRVSLSWTGSPATDLKHYELARGTTRFVVTGTSYVDTGLTNDTTYSYSLVAVDTSGNSSTAVTASATPTDLTPPAVPNNFTATAGDGRVTLAWTANTEPDLKWYRLTRNGVDVGTFTGTSHVDTGVVNDTPYTYRLYAVDHSGNESAAATAGATPTDTTPPAAPANLTATPGEGRIALTWTANSEPDLSHYRILRDGVVLVASTTATSYTDTGLTNYENHTYSVIAVDTHGNPSSPRR